MGLSRTLKETEPFNQLPDQVLAEISAAAVTEKYPPRCHIFNQHDPPSGYLYVIQEGQVEIVALTPGGVEMVVDCRTAGSCFGGTPVFTNEPYTAGARTVEKTLCSLIPQELVLKIARSFPQIAEHFNKSVYSRVRSLYSDLVSEHSQRALAQMEAYPFQKRLADIMTSPVETCSAETCVPELARRMTQKQIGAMLVCNNQQRLIGIISERDLISKVLTRESDDYEKITAREVMTPDPATMTPRTYMYEATSFLISHKIKHLPIIDEGKLVGIVSLQDLLKYRSQKSMLLISRARKAQSIEELAQVKLDITKIAKALISETRSHCETVEILSYIHHCILKRGYQLVQEKIQQQGLTQPDIRHCFIIMGSGGRKEMLLGPDQDHGFIFEDFPDCKLAEVNDYFVPFAEQLVEAYANIGYPRCNGKVMADNPLWRGRLTEWRARISDWINTPEPQKVRYSTIFFDFMPLVGDPSLCQDLRDIVHAKIRKFPLFLYHVMALDFKHKVPLGLLGRFTLDKDAKHQGQLSIKQNGSIFIVDCVRMFMLEKQADATTTIERLDKLVELRVLNQDTAEHLKAAFEAFTFLRLRNEIALAEQGKTPTHYLDPYALSKDEQDLLREAFRAASKLQDSAKRHFNVG